MTHPAKTNAIAIKQFFDSDAAKRKMQELIGKNFASFATSAMQIVNSNSLLQNASRRPDHSNNNTPQKKL